MPVVDHARQTVFVKIVYYGTGLSGKTTNLQTLHRQSRPAHRGKLLSLESGAERTLFFDLMPVELGRFRDYVIRLHLCTVPGQIAFDEMRRIILRHADAVVFVADSQAAALEQNMESLRDLDINLRSIGVEPQTMPMAVQYNKRDLPGVLPVHELADLLTIPSGVPQFEAIATTGLGVSETLKAPVKLCLSLLGDPAALPAGRAATPLSLRRPRICPNPAAPRVSRLVSLRPPPPSQRRIA